MVVFRLSVGIGFAGYVLLLLQFTGLGLLLIPLLGPGAAVIGEAGWGWVVRDQVWVRCVESFCCNLQPCCPASSVAMKYFGLPPHFHPVQPFGTGFTLASSRATAQR